MVLASTEQQHNANMIKMKCHFIHVCDAWMMIYNACVANVDTQEQNRLHKLGYKSAALWAIINGIQYKFKL